MLALLRKHQYALFVIVAIVGIAFFVFPDSRATQNRFGGKDGRAMNVLGTTIPPEEIDAIRDGGSLLVAMASGYGQQYSMYMDPMYQHVSRLSSLVTKARSTDAKSAEEQPDFVINTALTRVLARRLGISASEAEVNERIQTLPKFQEAGKFHPEKWSDFINAAGGEAGARRKVIYKAVADTIIFDKLAALVGEKVPASKTEIDLAYALENQRTVASVVTLAKKDFENQEVTEEEIKAYYEKNKSTLLTDEKRGFSYVLIAKAKPEELKDLDEAKKAEKEREHKKTAASFSEKLVAEDRGAKKFTDIAAELNLEVKSAGPFSRADIPEELKKQLQGRVLHDVFAIPEVGRSEVVESPDGYYAVELTAIEPPAPMSLDTAREKITTALKAEKQKEKFDAFVKSSREKIQAAVAAGKSFADAVKEAGLTVTPRDLPAFSKKKPVTGEADFQLIAETAGKTDVGQISDPVDTAEGKLLVFVTRKELPKDPKMEDDKKAMASRLSSSGEAGSSPAFLAWFTKYRNETDAGLTAR